MCGIDSTRRAYVRETATRNLKQEVILWKESLKRARKDIDIVYLEEEGKAIQHVLVFLLRR
jgi:hypothetical protein